MAAVDRAAFVPEEWRGAAGEDRPLPIGFGQTVSQPYTVARMLELLGSGRKVLEVGTGSGWQTAILARLFDRVYSVEIIPELAREAEVKIQKLEIRNVKIKIGDGKGGWKRYAPFDGIVVAAEAWEVPPALIEQLAEGGRMVIPVKGEMMVGEKRGGRVKWERHGSYIFVPLI